MGAHQICDCFLMAAYWTLVLGAEQTNMSASLIGRPGSSTSNLQLSTSTPADYPIFWRETPTNPEHARCRVNNGPRGQSVAFGPSPAIRRQLIAGLQGAFRFLMLWRAPHAAGDTYGFRSARNVCSRLQFAQTNVSLCFPKVPAAGSISLSCSSPPHKQCKEGGGSTRERM